LRRRLALLGVVLAAVLWTSALIAAPSSPAPRLSAMVYAAGSMVCHQRPERSFHRSGAQYPVCARCLGLYGGGVAGAIAWVLASGFGMAPRPRAQSFATNRLRGVLVVAAIPTIASVLSAATGLWDPSNTIRALLAVPLGSAVAAVVMAVAAGDMR
jgi:uncharacterized membrane protein